MLPIVGIISLPHKTFVKSLSVLNGRKGLFSVMVIVSIAAKNIIIRDNNWRNHRVKAFEHPTKGIAATNGDYGVGHCR
jgi:hypothetical protein